MKNIFSKIKEEKLTNTEKSEMLFALKNFIKENPVSGNFSKVPVKSPFYSQFYYFIREKRLVAPMALVLIFVITGSTVFGSNSSLPGDILYPVKILNENITSKVTVGTEAKARVSTLQALNRLEEAEKLAEVGKLTEEKAHEIEVKFNEHINETKKKIAELKNEEGDEKAKKVSSVFDESLSKQKDRMEKFVKEKRISTSSREQITIINTRIEEVRKENEDDENEDKDKIEIKIDLKDKEKIENKDSKDIKPEEENKNQETKVENED